MKVIWQSLHSGLWKLDPHFLNFYTVWGPVCSYFLRGNENTYAGYLGIETVCYRIDIKMTWTTESGTRNVSVGQKVQRFCKRGRFGVNLLRIDRTWGAPGMRECAQEMGGRGRLREAEMGRTAQGTGNHRLLLRGIEPNQDLIHAMRVSNVTFHYFYNLDKSLWALGVARIWNLVIYFHAAVHH